MKTVEELNVCFALTDGVKMVNHKSRKLIGQLISRLATMHIICYDDYIIGNTLVVEMEDICYEHVCLYGKRGARGSELVPKEWTTKKWTAKNYQDYGGDKSPFGLCDICVFVVKDKEDINSIEDMLKVAIAKFRKPVHIVIDDEIAKT